MDNPSAADLTNPSRQPQPGVARLEQISRLGLKRPAVARVRKVTFWLAFSSLLSVGRLTPSSRAISAWVSPAARHRRWGGGAPRRARTVRRSLQPLGPWVVHSAFQSARARRVGLAGQRASGLTICGTRSRRRLVRAGVDVVTVARLLRLRSLRTVLPYAHAMEGQARHGVRVLSTSVEWTP